MTLAPSVFTVHDVALNDASARRISDGVRGVPSVRFGTSGSDGGFCPRPPRPPRPSDGVSGICDFRHAHSSFISCEPGITSGASQNAYQRFLLITSSVSSTPAARSGLAWSSAMRRTPLTT